MAQEKANRVWKASQPLTAEDEKLLEPLKRRARELGYTPPKSELAGTDRIKQRFRTWGNAVMAAGLPGLNEKEQQALRAQARRKKKAVGKTPA